MKIAVFFTYQYSINTLEDAGIFKREMAIYKKIEDLFNVKFVFFTYESNPNDYFIYDGFHFIPIYNYISHSKNQFFSLIMSFLLPFKLRKITSEFNILHQHQLLGSWIPLLLKLLTKKPVLTRTGYDAYQFSIKNNDSLLKKIFYKILTKLTLRFSDTYTVTSQSDLKFLESNFKKRQIKLVPNWVEVNNNFNIEKYPKKILMVGRFEYQKNYHFALDFLRNLDLDVELDVYGSGSLKKEIKKIAKIHNLKVNFLNRIPHNELIEEYKKYFYYLSTSLFEGNPKTILEAMANGCTVFASKNSNNEEIIKHKINGFLFSNMNELINDFKNVYIGKYEIDFKNVESNLQKHNNIENIAKKMCSDYKDLIDTK